MSTQAKKQRHREAEKQKKRDLKRAAAARDEARSAARGASQFLWAGLRRDVGVGGVYIRGAAGKRADKVNGLYRQDRSTASPPDFRGEHGAEDGASRLFVGVDAAGAAHWVVGDERAKDDGSVRGWASSTAAVDVGRPPASGDFEVSDGAGSSCAQALVRATRVYCRRVLPCLFARRVVTRSQMECRTPESPRGLWTSTKRDALRGRWDPQPTREWTLGESSPDDPSESEWGTSPLRDPHVKIQRALKR